MKKQKFSLLEVMCSIFLATMLIVVCFSLHSNLKRASKNFRQETQAILVMQNTLQRLRTVNQINPDDVEKILFEEAKQFSFLIPKIEQENDNLILILQREKKTNLVKVKLKCSK